MSFGHTWHARHTAHGSYDLRICCLNVVRVVRLVCFDLWWRPGDARFVSLVTSTRAVLVTCDVRGRRRDEGGGFRKMQAYSSSTIHPGMYCGDVPPFGSIVLFLLSRLDWNSVQDWLEWRVWVTMGTVTSQNKRSLVATEFALYPDLKEATPDFFFSVFLFIFRIKYSGAFY